MKSIILTISLRIPDEMSDDYFSAHWEIKKQRQGLQVYEQEALRCLHYECKPLLYFGYQIPPNCKFCCKLCSLDGQIKT